MIPLCKWNDLGCIAVYSKPSGEVIGQVVETYGGWTVWVRPIKTGTKFSQGLIIVGAVDDKETAKASVERYHGNRP